MPYRIDIPHAPVDALDQLVQVGALDVEPHGEGLAAIIPDGVSPDVVARAIGVSRVAVSPAVSWDEGSVWLLSRRAVRIGSVLIVPPGMPAPATALRIESSAFGSGHHPTTALCIEAIEEVLAETVIGSVLDVGTGSGVLALAALKLGVPKAVALDIDPEALKVAFEHARLNNLADRLRLEPGGPDAVHGAWPLVVANVLAASLIDIAAVLVRRVEGGGRLILSGIAASLESEVRQTYQKLGMRHIRSQTRAAWTVLVAKASW